MKALTEQKERIRKAWHDAGDPGPALQVVFVLIAAIIGVIVLNALLPAYKSAVSGLATNLSATGWGSTAGNQIASAMGTILPIVAVVALVVLAFAAFRFGIRGRF